jgi:phage baseplate assembly protein W
MNVDFPFRIAADGRTATAPDAKHVRDMIEILLFTQPGERVMRPDFGSGLLQYVFAPNSAELAAALKLTVQSGLEQWLGDIVDVRALEIEAIDSTLSVRLDYAIRATGDTRSETFVRSAS